MPLSLQELSRYSRHLALPEVGREGQEKLKQASALVIGAGGLGSPVALYLAAAGVGTIGIADFDRVEESNLQRQIIHGTASVGRPKLASAAARIRDLNPHVEVEEHAARLDSSNALEILGRYDVVIDGTDNFPTRYLVNDAAVLLGKPNVYGSIFRFEGQASVFSAAGGPCYRCLYPEPPPPALVPNCEEGGVLGVVPGIIGSIQATEALKLLLRVGKTLSGRLLLFDAARMTFREIAVRRNPACRVCGDAPTVTTLIDYEGFCGYRAPVDSADIAPQELRARLDRGDELLVLDVREDYEWAVAHLEEATHIPMGRLRDGIATLPRDREIVVYCRSGSRSANAAAMLRNAGFARVKNLTGGLTAWSREVDPSIRVV
ncbi:MAG TPA: molybdopterin-synthase adenylyltransferase MoeB [Thermoanaerobaculia bacterium]|nr:molybdopterin-synthase adenylyltransferase MoeB [Thermoanaerobaculia bacterium]